MPPQARAEPRSLEFGSQRRTYELHVPTQVRAAAKPAPLVVTLHGGGMSGSQMQRVSGWNATADRAGFIVAYPDAPTRHWNDGRSATAIQQTTDDIAFISQLVRTLIDQKLADPSRIYATGISNGGMMTYRLACETAGIFAGYAAGIANLPAPLAKSCKPSTPVPMLIMNGTSDPLMPFNGGSVGGGGDRGTVTSTLDTFAFWKTANGCRGQDKVRTLPDADPNDGSTIEVSEAGCPAAAPARLYTVKGGGHQMPRKAQTVRIFDRLLGPGNHDIEASDEIWQFLAPLSRARP